MMKSFDSTMSASEVKTAMPKNKDILFLDRTGLSKTFGLAYDADIAGGSIVDSEKERDSLIGIDHTNVVIAIPDADFFPDNHIQRHNR